MSAGAGSWPTLTRRYESMSVIPTWNTMQVQEETDCFPALQSGETSANPTQLRHRHAWRRRHGNIPQRNTDPFLSAMLHRKSRPLHSVRFPPWRPLGASPGDEETPVRSNGSHIYLNELKSLGFWVCIHFCLTAAINMTAELPPVGWDKHLACLRNLRFDVLQCRSCSAEATSNCVSSHSFDLFLRAVVAV